MFHSRSHCLSVSMLATASMFVAIACQNSGSSDGSGGATGSAGQSASGTSDSSGGRAGSGDSGTSAVTGGSSTRSSGTAGAPSSAGRTVVGGTSGAGQGGTGGTSATGGATGGHASGGEAKGGSSAGASGGKASGGAGASGGTTSGGAGSGSQATGGATGTSSGSNTGEPSKSAGCGTTNPPKTGKYTITAAGLNRTYVIDVPSNYDPNKAYKLLFAWHPNAGNAQSIADTDGGYYGIKPIANNTTIFVAGDGIDAGWANTNDRDIAFVKAMLDRFYGQLCIDKSRIFSTGWSYGGMFSYALGCAMGDVFRAIAPTSGALMSGCAEGTHPVAMWGAHGVNDNLVNISGGRSARDVFLTRNHCSKTTSAPDANKCVSYEGCDAGYPVVWCEWGGGHLYPPFGAAETWKFFSKF